MKVPWQNVLHLGDAAFTSSVLARAARKRGYEWAVLPFATTAQHSSRFLTAIHRAGRGALWEVNLARHRIRYPLIHLHSALALPHVKWALGTYALHLHGTDIRTQQYKPEFRNRVLSAIEGAAVVFYSTPDLREHCAPHREDAILAPVPVGASQTQRGSTPALLSGQDYIFFVSRWESAKGGKRQIELVRALRAQLANSVQLVGLDWGANAQEARNAGVKLIPKQNYPNFLATIAGASLAIGQLSGVMGASELDALDLNVPLLMPLNAEWYDGSAPALNNPPVIGGTQLNPEDADGLVHAALEALEATSTARSHDWIQQHHSPDAILDVLLDGYSRHL